MYVRRGWMTCRATKWETSSRGSNRSAVVVLVECSPRLVLLAKMDDATAGSALEGYTRKLILITAPMRQSLTYEQG